MRRRPPPQYRPSDSRACKASIRRPRAPMKGDVGAMSAVGASEAMDRITALESAVGAGQQEAAILAALGDPSTLVRERAIALAARHLLPESLGTLLRDDEN